MNSDNVASRQAKNLQAIRLKGVDIAEKTIVREGIQALSARRLAKGIGCSVGSLYNAFGDLDTVVRDVNLRTVERLAAQLNAQADHGLLGLAEAYFDFALENRELWWALFDYRMQTPPDGRVEQVQRGLIDLLRRAAGVGQSTKPEVLIQLRLAWASVHGLVAFTLRGTIVDVAADDARRYLAYLVARWDEGAAR